jgi:hypothetical protein
MARWRHRHAAACSLIVAVCLCAASSSVTRASGARYRWRRGGPLAPLPAWLATLLERAPAPVVATVPQITTGSRYLRRALEAELDGVATAPEGTRNTTLNRAALRIGQLAGALGEPDDVERLLLDAARAAGLGEREAEATIASGLRAGRGQPRPIRPRQHAGHGPTHP